MNTEIDVLQQPGDLTPAWLQAALGSGPIASVTSVEVGTGQMSDSHRVTIAYEPGADPGPTSVVIKFAASDPTSRGTGVGLGAYEREVRFYRELAPRLGGPIAHCYAAVIDPDEGWFTLVLEDMAPAEQGDQVAGCSVEEARLAIRELARLHAPVFADSQLGATPWLNQPFPLNQAILVQLLAGFFERYEDRIAPEHRTLCERFVASLDGWIADRRPPLGLVHGDYRLDNMLFGGADAPRPFVVVDWQTVGWGPVMTDAAYFLGSSLTVEDRRAHDEELVREYHAALEEHGVRGFSWEDCWAGYRRQCFLGILMVIAPAMLVERTERGDEMFMTSLARYAQQAIDLDAASLLPEPGSGRPAPLRPEPEDEGRHPHGPEQLWNESWYFDAVREDGSLGMYTRLGLYPNLGVAWLTAIVCGPGRETVAVVDFAVPMPGEGSMVVEHGALQADHVCEESLQRYRVRLGGPGEAHADASALLRGEAGRAVDVAFDLVWETHGEPYAYRVATRYEIPCRVSGTIRVGDEELTLDGVGQRDHSWGTRDWWAAEWMWSAGHLEDGSRFHGVEFRLPDTPRLGAGYRQPAEGGVLEIDAVSADEQVGADGLITSARIELDGEAESLAVEPIAHGPLRLVAPDGRVTLFPRAMCRVTAGDGRRGVAWVEWNRNRSAGL